MNEFEIFIYELENRTTFISININIYIYNTFYKIEFILKIQFEFLIDFIIKFFINS